VGDRVIVHLHNALPEATTIHWHGLRIPAEMDGVPAMQSPIEPGDDFTYDFVVPEALLAWYHPHLRADVQVERGLQAAFVVRDPDAEAFGKETILVLDDVLLDDDDELADFADGHMARSGRTGHMDEMRGRIGNTILVNGHRRPVLEVKRGERQLFRIVNTANARIAMVRLPGHTLTWIGTDGGLLAEPREVEALVLAPGERADVLFSVDEAAGSTLDFEVSAAPLDTVGGGLSGAAVAWRSTWPGSWMLSWMGHSGDDSTYQALHVRVVEGEAERFADLPDRLNDIPNLTRADRDRDIAFTGGMMGNFGFGGEQWPDVPLLHAEVGDVERWTLINSTGMPHPFHLHGNRFQVLDVDGWPAAWKDNVLVPPNASVRLMVSLDGHPGHWMYHCHILEHAEGGMMGGLMLE
jgi:FtsP/CotA-like multicopper oxidase with cupredoxin domain